MTWTVVIAFVLTKGIMLHMQAPAYPAFYQTQAECERVIASPDFKADLSALADRVNAQARDEVIVTAHCVQTSDKPDPVKPTPPKLPDTQSNFRG